MRRMPGNVLPDKMSATSWRADPPPSTGRWCDPYWLMTGFLVGRGVVGRAAVDRAFFSGWSTSFRSVLACGLERAGGRSFGQCALGMPSDPRRTTGRREMDNANVQRTRWARCRPVARLASPTDWRRSVTCWCPSEPPNGANVKHCRVVRHVVSPPLVPRARRNHRRSRASKGSTSQVRTRFPAGRAPGQRHPVSAKAG